MQSHMESQQLDFNIGTLYDSSDKPSDQEDPAAPCDSAPSNSTSVMSVLNTSCANADAGDDPAKEGLAGQEKSNAPASPEDGDKAEPTTESALSTDQGGAILQNLLSPATAGSGTTHTSSSVAEGSQAERSEPVTVQETEVNNTKQDILNSLGLAMASSPSQILAGQDQASVLSALALRLKQQQQLQQHQGQRQQLSGLSGLTGPQVPAAVELAFLLQQRQQQQQQQQQQVEGTNLLQGQRQNSGAAVTENMARTSTALVGVGSGGAGLGGLAGLDESQLLALLASAQQQQQQLQQLQQQQGQGGTTGEGENNTDNRDVAKPDPSGDGDRVDAGGAEGGMAAPDGTASEAANEDAGEPSPDVSGGIENGASMDASASPTSNTLAPAPAPAPAPATATSPFVTNATGPIFAGQGMVPVSAMGGGGAYTGGTPSLSSLSSTLAALDAGATMAGVLGLAGTFGAATSASSALAALEAAAGGGGVVGELAVKLLQQHQQQQLQQAVAAAVAVKQEQQQQQQQQQQLMMGNHHQQRQQEPVTIASGLFPLGISAAMEAGREPKALDLMQEAAHGGKVEGGEFQQQQQMVPLSAAGGAGSMGLEASQGGSQMVSLDGQTPPPAQKQTSSRYESQKRRDWNTFGQYLKNHRPPVAMSKCTSQHVVEFLRYLDQFGKTKVHAEGCPFYGSSGANPCGCPMKQAWGSLDSLIGRLRAAYEENGGKPELNPFGARIVRSYLRETRDQQGKARGIAYEKKKRKRSGAAAIGAGGGGPLGLTAGGEGGGAMVVAAAAPLGMGMEGGGILQASGMDVGQGSGGALMPVGLLGGMEEHQQQQMEQQQLEQQQQSMEHQHQQQQSMEHQHQLHQSMVE